MPTETDTRLVFWAGPVSSVSVAEATIPEAPQLVLTCTFSGGGDYHCPTLGTKLQKDPSLLAAKAGFEPTDIYMGSFSAGGSVLKRMLMDETYRAKTSFLHLADATYTSEWADPINQVPPAIEGFTRYAVDVVKGPGNKLMVVTASENKNYPWASGVENCQAMRAEIEKRTGKKFESLDHFFGIEPGPERGAHKLGNVIFGDYCSMAPCPQNIGHGGHLTTIGSQVWQKILLPWLDKGRGPVGEPGGLPDPWGGGWAPPWDWTMLKSCCGAAGSAGPAHYAIGAGGIVLGFVGGKLLYDWIRG